jgi:hypothetical protein
MIERDYRHEYRAIMEALAESVSEASDAEILEDVELAGEDGTKTAEGVRQVLLDGLRKFRKARLMEARLAYERDIEEFGKMEWALPRSLADCRELLRRVFEQKPEFREALLTAQHRDFKSLSDEDIMSYLKELQALGVLEKLKKDE